MVLVCAWFSPIVEEVVWLDTCRTFSWRCYLCRFIHTLHPLRSNLPLSFHVSLSSQFMGRWFEIAKLPAQFERGRCIESNFTLTPGNSIRVVSSEILWVFTPNSESKNWSQRVDVSTVCALRHPTWSVSVWNGTERVSWGKSKGPESLRI